MHRTTYIGPDVVLSILRLSTFWIRCFVVDANNERGLCRQVLSDPEQRMVYDEINGYALTSANPFLNANAQDRDHAFVDEFTCIGKQSTIRFHSKTWLLQFIKGSYVTNDSCRGCSIFHVFFVV